MEKGKIFHNLKLINNMKSYQQNKDQQVHKGDTSVM